MQEHVLVLFIVLVEMEEIEMQKQILETEVKKFNRSDWGRRIVSIEEILAILNQESYKILQEDALQGIAES